MENRMNWPRVFGFSWRTGVVVGILVGFQEGFLSSTTTSGGSTNVPITSIPQLLQVYFTPIFAEAMLWGLIGAILGLLFYGVFGRILKLSDRDRFVPFFIGFISALATFLYVFLMFNPNLVLGMMLSPAKIFFNLRLMLVSLLVGAAFGFSVPRFRHSPRMPRIKGLLLSITFWVILITPIVLWVSRTYLEYDFGLVFISVMVLILAVLIGLIWVSTFFLGARFQRDGNRSPLARFPAEAALVVLALLTFLPLFFKKAEIGTLVAGGGQSPHDLNVVLLSIDTLRADRISAYSGEYSRTPNIDRLASEGVLFSRNQSQSSWTLPSLCSMLTSMYPTAHGVDRMMDRLDNMRETMAEQISDAGYLTGAVVSNGWLLEPFGAAQGFDVFDHMKHRLRAQLWNNHIWLRVIRSLTGYKGGTDEQDDTADSRLHVKYALEFLDANKDNNFFLWVHVIDPHEPYVARGPWIEEAGKEFPSTKVPRLNSGMVISIRRGNMLEKVDRQHIADLYNREVEYTDQQMGIILDRIRELGLLRNTMVIFTADHGEEFWDHNDVSHGHTFYREVVNVPLIIRPPDGYPVAQERVDTQVRLIDVAPTILDFFELPNLQYAEGRSLLPLIRGEEEPEDRPAFYEAMIYYLERKGYSDGRYKYIFSEEEDREELYDLLEDPEEKRNLAEDMPEKRLEMKGILLEHLNTQRGLERSLEKTGAEAEIDEDTRQHLRALGYIQ